MVRQPGPRLTRRSRPRLSRPDAFPSPLRSTRLTSQLGIALGSSFAICFVTGVLSHLVQHPPGWFEWPSRPVQLYRITQGLHVATGLACVPLLGAKLWSVYPRLFRWPPVRGLAHAAERAGIAALVAASLFQLVTGLLNISLWYGPMPFFFPVAHYWTAWLVAGALLVHIGVQLPAVRQALSRREPSQPALSQPALSQPGPSQPGLSQPGLSQPGLSRRGLLAAVAGATGVITVATVGQTVAPLATVSPLAPRRPDLGPQGLPVNKSAAAAGVRQAALDPAYRLSLRGPRGTRRLGLADLAALPQHTAVLPIACVEGWSATGTWTGVRLRDLVELAGADPETASALVESLQRGGLFRSTLVPAAHVRDPLTLVALRLGGEPLDLDHGYPVRLIAPNRPGVLQTKWIGQITIGRDR